MIYALFRASVSIFLCISVFLRISALFCHYSVFFCISLFLSVQMFREVATLLPASVLISRPCQQQQKQQAGGERVDLQGCNIKAHLQCTVYFVFLTLYLCLVSMSAGGKRGQGGPPRVQY